MNICYNASASRFEAQFSTDFQGDLAAVKAAKFRCDGPPSWLWWTVKLPALNALRANKPISGLTISEEAYAVYMRLSEMEARNAEARKLFAPVKEKQVKAKKERKKQEIKDRTYTTIVIPEKPGEDYNYIGPQDLPPMLPFEHKNKPAPHLGPWCAYCRAPVYFYEKQEPPTCLWCEITIDRARVSC